MRTNILYFLAVFVMPMVLSAAPILSLAGVDSNGAPMRFGSGVWTESFCHPALVSDEGTVLFIAQMPDEFLDGADNRDRFRAVYQKHKTDASSEMRVDGYNLVAYMLGERWWQFNWQINGTGSPDVFFLIREDFTGEGGSSLNLRRFPDDIFVPLSSDVVEPTLRLTSVGNMVSITAVELQKPLLYQVTDDGFTAIEIPDPSFAGYTQTGIALSPDGTGIYFTSTADFCNSDEYVPGKLGLYAYDRILQSHQLVAFIGDSTLDSQVQCAAEAEVLVFRSTLIPDAPAGTQIVVAELEPSGNYVLYWCSPEGLSDCANPQISADGRFVVFSAKIPGNAFRQIFRFDRLSSQLEPVSKFNDIWADADAHTPAISPNGRYVALVSAATNFGHDSITLPQVWLTDLGPSLLQTSVDIFQQQTHELPIDISGASENASITLLPGEPVPAGTFLDKNGNPLSLNLDYSLDSLPWTYQAGETESGTITVTIQITDGTFTKTAELQIHIHDQNKAVLSCVSLNAEGEYATALYRNFSDASCSEDGSRIAFVTSLPLMPAHTTNVSHAYYRNLISGELTLLSGDLNQKVTKITISGDGDLVYFIRSGKLWKYTVATGQFTELISSGTDNIKPATDVSGTILAYSQNGQAVLQFPGQDPVSPAPDLICKALRLNRDGKVLALLDSANALHIWFADAAQLVKLAENVDEFAMNQSGTEVFFLQGDKLCRQNTAQGVANEVTLPAGITATNLQNLQLCGNGRFLTWVRDLTLNEVLYPGQQFLFVLNSSRELLISSSGPDQPGNGECSTLSPTAFSASGRKLFFASLASNLLSADNNNAQDLFQATLPDIPADAPAVSPEILPATEDTPADLPLALISPEGNALVPLLVSGESAQGVQLTLLGPVPGRNGYAVHYAPLQDFCGSDSFQVQLWDGAALSEPQTVTVDVANVNDPPVAQPVTANNLEEGAGLTVDLQDFASDPDLHNPTPDSLSFALPEGSPAWARVDGTELILTPGYLTVTHAENGREFSFQVQVCDNQGSCVNMPVTVAITDMNQPPTLQLTQNTITQQGDEVILPADIFVAADSDPEDMDSLLIRMQTGIVSYEIPVSDFPYAFTPPADTVDQLQFEVYAKDAGGAMSASKSLTIQLLKVTFQTGEFWGYIPTSNPEDNPSWNALRYGWNLLSIPFAAGAGEISGIFGEEAILWIWDTENKRYARTDALHAGQGFWIYINDLAAISPAEQILVNGRTASPALPRGWNLRGTNWQNIELPPGWNLSPARNWEKTGSFLPGKAYWFFAQ